MSDMKTARNSAMTILLSFAIVPFIFLSAFWPSGTEASTPALLDYSWQLVLEYAFQRGLGFGRDLIYTYGPLGFLDAEVSRGHLLPFRIVFAAVWAGIVAGTAFSLTKDLPRPIRWFFIAWTGVFSTLGGLELHIYQVFGYCAWQILFGPKRRGTVILWSLICFAFLSLIKFTMLVAAGTTIAICTIVKLAERKYGKAASLTGGYVLLLWAGWMAVGQKMSLLIPWLQGGSEIARGYALAMSYLEGSPVVYFCFAAMAGMFIMLGLSLFSSDLRPARLGFVACLSCYAFLCWKHAVIRPDPEHFYWLFVPLPLLCCFLWLPKPDFFPLGPKRWIATAGLFLTIISCLIGMETGNQGVVVQRLLGLPRYLVIQAACVKDLLTGHYDKVYAAQQQVAKPWVPDISTIRRQVKDEPIDVFNYQQWVAIETGLNYVPRPVMQGYQAYTPYLADINGAFYNGPRAPAFVLMNMETIDNRFPTLDDPRVFAALLLEYRPVLSGHSFILLQRSNPVPFRLEPVLKRSLRFGESVDVSPWAGSMLFLRIYMKPSAAVTASRFIFKEPLVTMNVNCGNGTKEFRFIPIMGTTPFLLSPLIESNQDMLNVYEGDYTKQLQSFSLQDKSGWFGNDNKRIEMVLYKVQDLKQSVN